MMFAMQLQACKIGADAEGVDGGDKNTQSAQLADQLDGLISSSLLMRSGSLTTIGS